jgi:hypothetical protein
MEIKHYDYDTFENESEISGIVEKNKSKIFDYVSQPDLWNTPIRVSAKKKIVFSH